MSLNYVSDNSGNPIAVQISIEDRKRIKDKYPDVDDLDSDVSQWQKQIVISRAEAAQKEPDLIKPIDDLFNEPDEA